MDILYVSPRTVQMRQRSDRCQEALHLSKTEEVLRCNDALEMYAGELLVC